MNQQFYKNFNYLIKENFTRYTIQLKMSWKSIISDNSFLIWFMTLFLWNFLKIFEKCLARNDYLVKKPLRWFYKFLKFPPITSASKFRRNMKKRQQISSKLKKFKIFKEINSIWLLRHVSHFSTLNLVISSVFRYFLNILNISQEISTLEILSSY